MFAAEIETEFAAERERHLTESVAVADKLARLTPEELQAAARFRPLAKLQVLLRAQDVRIAILLQDRNRLAADLWRAESELAPLRGRLTRTEYELSQARREISRALQLVGAAPPAAEPVREPRPDRGGYGRRPDPRAAATKRQQDETMRRLIERPVPEADPIGRAEEERMALEDEAFEGQTDQLSQLLDRLEAERRRGELL